MRMRESCAPCTLTVLLQNTTFLITFKCEGCFIYGHFILSGFFTVIKLMVFGVLEVLATTILVGKITKKKKFSLYISSVVYLVV